MFRRLADIVLSSVGLVVLSPLFLVLAARIRLEDGSPVFFRQSRVGRNGRRFNLWKFRSMRKTIDGPLITSGNDSRVTRVGKTLRKYKLDELPQLWNVLIGDMSLIGPRPEVPPYVDEANEQWRRVLTVRPGVTDYASLLFRHEESLLAQAKDPERYYRDQVLPRKLALSIEYIEGRSAMADVRLVLMTVRSSFLPTELDPVAIRRAVLGK